MNGSLSLTAIVAAALIATGAIAGSPGIPEKKQTKAGLYLTALEAATLLEDERVLLLDVRSRPEVSFLGLPVRANAHIPFMVMPPEPVYDPGSGTYGLVRNDAFEMDFEDFADLHEIDPQTRIVLLCRSGSRSAKAADALYDLGFRNVYSIVDGYEGDKAAEGPMKGQRVVNGWRNAGLPWTYAIAPAAAYAADRM